MMKGLSRWYLAEHRLLTGLHSPFLPRCQWPLDRKIVTNLALDDHSIRRKGLLGALNFVRLSKNS